MLSATKYKSLCNSENQKDAKCLMKMNDCIIKKNGFKNNHMYDNLYKELIQYLFLVYKKHYV